MPLYLIPQVTGSFVLVPEEGGQFVFTNSSGGQFYLGQANTGATGATGLITVDAPLIYDSEEKNLSIESGFYLTVSDAQDIYQPISGMSAYLTTASAAATYYPLSNPTGYITSAALSGYATESWVLNNGYITASALTPYLLSSTAASTYATITALSAGLATKQPVGDYATNTALDTVEQNLQGQIDGKQPVGDYATNAALFSGLATKQPVGDYATNADLTAGLATKQPIGDYATNSALNAVESDLQGQIDGKQPAGDYATNSALTAGLATKQPVGDYATNTALTDGLATKANVVHTHTIAQVDGLSDELAGKQPVGDYATNTALTTGLAGKADVIHTHDASAIVSGVIDIARIPVIPSQVQVFASEPDITQLTTAEQDQITGAGVVVVLSNGERWMYKGTGSKTDYASYVQISDLTPDWNSIENKPSVFPPAAHTHPISEVIGLQTALDGKSPLFDQSLNTTDSVQFANVQTESITIPNGSNDLIIDESGILFTDGTLQNTAGVSQASLTSQLGAYLTTADATSTYQPISGMSNYLTVVDAASTYYPLANPNGYISSAALAGYATESWVTLNFAPVGWNPFNQVLNTTSDAAFNKVTASAAGSVSTVLSPSVNEDNAILNWKTGAGFTLKEFSLSPNRFRWQDNSTSETIELSQYGLSVYESYGSVDVYAGEGIYFYKNSTGQQWGFDNVALYFADGTSQSTAGISLATAASTYYPLTNPSGYITSSALADYATESWVASQGYLTAPYNPFDQSLNTTNSPSFSGLSVTGDVVLNDLATPSSTYQFKWNAASAIAGIYGGAVPIVELTSNGIVFGAVGASLTFSDGTVQTTAATTPDLSGYAQKAVSNTFTANQVISVTDNTNAALRITQTGTGEAFRVEDEANPDSTPFVITASGQVGIGTATVGTNAITAIGNAQFSGITTVGNGLNVAGASTLTVASGTSVPLTIQNNGTGNSFVVNDQASDTTPFIVNAAGATIIGGTSPLAKLTVAELGTYSTSNSSSYPAVAAVSTGTAVGLRIQNDSTSAYSLVIRNGTTDNKVIVNKDGQVGIGVTPSSYPLEVGGTASVTSVRFGDGTIQSSAATAANQSLNTTDNVSFASVTAVAAGQVGTLLTGGVDENAKILNWSTGSGFTLKEFYIKPNDIRYTDNGSSEYWQINQYGLSVYESYGSVDAYAGEGIYFYNNATGQSFSFSQYGLYFPDGTIQTTASSYNQTLNTTSGVRFASVHATQYDNSFPYSSLMGAWSSDSNQGIYVETSGELKVFSGSSYTGLTLTPTGITFPDGTTQTTAGGGGSYNQDLNTYDSPSFVGLTTNGDVTFNRVSDSVYTFEWDATNGVASLNSGTPMVSLDNAVGLVLHSGLWGDMVIKFPDNSTQSHAYPFSGATATAIEGGLLNANSPSSTNAFATLGDVESSVNAYAASVLPVLPTTDQKAAMGNADSPSASNPFLTATALPVGSESQAGLLELANSTESLDYTNATKPLATDKTLNFLRRFLLKRGVTTILGNLTAQVTGTGTQYSQVQMYANVVPPNASVVGFTRGYTILNSGRADVLGGAFWSFNEPVAVGHTMYLNNASTRVGTRVMSTLGETSFPTAGVVIGDPTSKRIGWSFYIGGTIQLMVHDGTTLRFVDTGYAPPVDNFTRRHYIEYGLDGAGNGYLYVKTDTGAEYTAVSPNAPTGALASGTNSSYMLQISTNGTQTSNGTNYSTTHPVFYFP